MPLVHACRASRTARLRLAVATAAVSLLLLTPLAQAQFTAPSSGPTTPGSVSESASGSSTTTQQLPVPGTMRLTQPNSERRTERRTERELRGVSPEGSERTGDVEPIPYVPSEFERFVQRHAGAANVRRFGFELVGRAYDSTIADASPVIPPDYPVAPGDEVLVTLWGSVDADLRLVVDRSGRINVPRVGSITVSGVRHADLTDVIGRRVAQVFRNYQLSVSLGALRGIRVYVTGFAARPGAYTVNSLSTVSSALFRAGGPSGAGSFRNVELRRGGQVLSVFDLYDFMLKGDRAADRLLQAGDVIHVSAVGDQVGLVGSVNKPAIIELKAGETVADVLRMGGGFSAVADRYRLAVERLTDRNATRVRELSLPSDLALMLGHGDVLRVFSAVDAVLPVQRQNKRVRVEGEVARPGDYVMPPDSTINDALRAAGGLTTAAFLYGTDFGRESVRVRQQENYDRALRDLETDVARQGTTRASNSEEVAASNARVAATTRLVERLRAIRPTGRIVLQMTPESTELPDLALEDGDRLFIPPRPTTVGVFGSVFNGGSYLYGNTRSIGDYLRLAGGPTKGADEGSVFVVRANGQVVSSRQRGGFFNRTSVIQDLPAEPGDTVFVPEEMDKTTFIQSAKDWTQILYNFGIGLAGIKSATQ